MYQLESTNASVRQISKIHQPMTQASHLLQLLKDHKPHRTDEILREVYGSEHLGIARIGARIDDLKKLGHHIVGYHDPQNRKLYVYELIPPRVPELLPAFEKPPEPQKRSNTNQTLFL
jgi:hypothetical protein